VHWLEAVQRLRQERRPGVLVTLTSVRGHAPRDAGAKMVVTDREAWGSIGGGNLEATAVGRARAMLATGDPAPQSISLSLNERAPVEHGQQCCGGEVEVLLEPLAVVPSVAVFGVGHVGLELARVLARLDLELHLVDSRADQLGRDRLAVLDDAVAGVHVHHAPVPELVLGEVPPGTHVLVMTHDHAEDAALCDAALRCAHLGSIGLIGSSAKWRRFEQRLRAEGHPPEALRRIQTPIGLPDIVGKEPAVVAVSVAAALVRVFEAEAAAAGEAAAGARTEARGRRPAPRTLPGTAP
jgi:xanthine dehydrogenase accessory factor